ncbi:50S ribosomal protein L6 [Candidatus Wolfebacteria bacterium CG10_big_fil_rev_8_21_14_0_10_31_9]|uniref:50S ribosomal protein L6 n=1 Tax=Candidatus Wolfebacteria bacterium CG10_big_fil_rev_8_21_14_0_10_31_9 TaxID=1975070 RepID=A0A2H0RCD0_9BACT|nr:MAG: 50S ribosomal protein L6 [Candidatus Wolfebacteria bacterium CG10_big_fil_rev_8_21_14_0_10_31_9]
MSKIGKKPIIIPDGISIKIDSDILEIKKGENAVNLNILKYIKVVMSEEKDENEKVKNLLILSIESDLKQAKANWGTMRALTQNTINGLEKNFEKVLEIEGIGYRVSMEGETLVLTVGFSHPVKYPPVKGIKISTEKNTIKISGIDKSAVGQTAAEIRAIKKPEPYKGKGIRYKGEVVRRKAGKKAGAK